MHYPNTVLLGLCLLLAQAASAQCAFTPTITGDTLLCPNTEQGMLSTQQYDAYQWYRRDFGGANATPIAGATGPTLAISGDDLLSYFSVDATLNNCTERSAEVLIDGWVFLLPVVAHGGDYIFDPDQGAFSICTGDTMTLELLQPYDTNITWFFDGAPIPGDTSNLLNVLRAGVYTVQGAPSVCPDFIRELGLDLVVVERQCTSHLPVLDDPTLRLFPNPATDVLHIRSDQWLWRTVEVFGPQGQLLFRHTGMSQQNLDLPLSGLPQGVYAVRLSTDEGQLVRRVVRQ